MAAKLEGHCPKCNGTMKPDVEELLSRPELGIVREVRPGQIELAKSIDSAIRAPENMIVYAEGGCGIGKTFSYLIPALLSNKRIIISTAKKALQDQLAGKDVPYLIDQLGLGQHTFVSIKGKSNYICRRLLTKNKKMFTERGQDAMRDALKEWADNDPVGDLNAFPGTLSYPATACTADECTGNSCKLRQTCGYLQVKNQAKEAMVVIANHSLVGFDLRLGVGRLFGEYSILIVDEGHSFPEYVRGAFSEDVSMTWLNTFFNKLARENINLDFNTKAAVKEWEKMFRSIPEHWPAWTTTAGTTSSQLVACTIKRKRRPTCSKRRHYPQTT
jgi:ATP-dependent DNA helicase DinG